MPRFHKSSHHVDHHSARILSKEELDAKHEAAAEAKAIISWKSAERIFKARSKKYFTKITLYGLLFILLAIVFDQVFLVGVIIAMIFVVFVLAAAAPEVIGHEVNNMGIISGGKVFLWEELDSFWFDKRGEDRLLLVQTKMHFPSQLIILLSSVSERTLLDVLEKHLHYHPSPVKTLFDKWAHSLQKRINFE